MYPEPTELHLIGCLTESIRTPPRSKSNTLTSRTNSQTYWQKRISHVMSGTIFFTCSTSAISAEFAALRISAWPAAPERWWKKDARTGKRRKDRGKVKADDESGLHCLDKFLDCAESDCVEKPGDTQGTVSKSLVKNRETRSKRIQSRRSVEFSRMAKRCISGPVATEEDQEHLNFLADLVSTGKLVAPGYPGNPGNPGHSGDSGTEGNDEDWPRNLHISTNFNRMRAAHGEGFLDCETQIWSQSDGSNERPPCERSHMGYISVCHSSSCSSSWYRLHV